MLIYINDKTEALILATRNEHNQIMYCICFPEEKEFGPWNLSQFDTWKQVKHFIKKNCTILHDETEC